MRQLVLYNLSSKALSLKYIESMMQVPEKGFAPWIRQMHATTYKMLGMFACVEEQLKQAGSKNLPRLDYSRNNKRIASVTATRALLYAVEVD